MISVYLAKSNKANPDVVGFIRKMLTEAGFKVNEYQGGTYCNDDCDDSDFFICIPSADTKVFGDKITLGKGLYEQVKSRIVLGKPVLFITNGLELIHYSKSINGSLLSGNLRYPKSLIKFTDCDSNFVEYGFVNTTNYNSNTIIKALLASTYLIDKLYGSKQATYIKDQLDIISLNVDKSVKEQSTKKVVNKIDISKKSKPIVEDNMMLLLLRKC